jgi:class 3 adenylate cyclase
VVITGVMIGCLAGAVLAGLRAAREVRQRRWMARHPAPTFVFADLVGYTAFTESSGDREAARVGREFGRAISLLSREHGAWHVKSTGDGAMIWAADAADAVVLAERALDEIGHRPDLLPVRVGVHTGPAVMVRGDWYGSAVNLAARLMREARPNEVLVSGATQSVADRAGLHGSLKYGGELAVRGVTGRVSVWRVPAVGRPHLRLLASDHVGLHAGHAAQPQAAHLREGSGSAQRHRTR